MSPALSFVSSADVKAHLRLLTAFTELRNAQGGDDKWSAYVSSCVPKFKTWVKQAETDLDNALQKADLDVLLVWHTYLLVCSRLLGCISAAVLTKDYLA